MVILQSHGVFYHGIMISSPFERVMSPLRTPLRTRTNGGEFRAPTTLKSEGEVTSLSGADKREVREQGEVVRVQGEVKIFL